MTNTAPMALMAAALILAMQGGGTREAGGAECPCVFTAEEVPHYRWKDIVGCESKAGVTTLSVNFPKKPSPSFAIKAMSQGYCIQRDKPGGKPRQKERVKSDDEVKACSLKIIEYAQELSDGPPKYPRGPLVLDSGCALTK